MKPKFLPGTVVVVNKTRTHGIVSRVHRGEAEWIYFLHEMMFSFDERELSEVEK